MPVLLVPASYVEGKTRSIAAAEAEHGSTEDTLVETTMGEVRCSISFRFKGIFGSLAGCESPR